MSDLETFRQETRSWLEENGPKGLRDIAERIHTTTRSLATALGANPQLSIVHGCYFDTLKIHVQGGGDAMRALRARAESKSVNRLVELTISHISNIGVVRRECRRSGRERAHNGAAPKSIIRQLRVV